MATTNMEIQQNVGDYYAYILFTQGACVGLSAPVTKQVMQKRVYI